MLEYAQKGALIDLSSIPMPQDFDVVTWLKMYISTGFVVAAPKDQAEQVMTIFEDHNLSAAVIGTVNDSQKLRIQLGEESETIFDFTQESIVAPPPPPQLNQVTAVDSSRQKAKEDPNHK